MKCITIERTVDAYEVAWLLKSAKENFAALPAWVKKMHQENKLLIGGSSINVRTKYYIEDVDKQHVLFRHENGDVEALLITEFYSLYKDAICG
ncbi:hypothetical protein [Acinetobacter seifertii]|uniref:hypothetical protein n=1 Tax=Acinetobacter seifertii TaxID=1530123 RepID=UPI003F521E34